MNHTINGMPVLDSSRSHRVLLILHLHRIHLSHGAPADRASRSSCSTLCVLDAEVRTSSLAVLIERSFRGAKSSSWSLKAVACKLCLSEIIQSKRAVDT